MSKRRAPDRQRVKPSASARPRNRRSRLLAGAALLVCLGVGAVAVERLTRPDDNRLSTVAIPQEAPIAEAALFVPPPRAEPTYTETVAEARQLGKEIMEKLPGDVQALALAGNVLFAFGDPEQAEAAWRRIGELDAQSAEAWLGLAKTAHKRGDFERAAQCMQQLSDVAPALADSHVFFLVDSLLKLGRPQEVIDRLEPLGQSATLPGGARVTLGQAYYQLRQFELSADQYRQALDDPQYAAVAHYGLSSSLMRLGRQDEAKQCRQEYARLHQKEMQVFDRMQRAGTDEERDDPASLYPLLASFHFEAAKLYAIRGQRERAAKHAFRAWAFAPDRPEPRALLESLSPGESP